MIQPAGKRQKDKSSVLMLMFGKATHKQKDEQPSFRSISRKNALAGWYCQPAGAFLFSCAYFIYSSQL